MARAQRVIPEHVMQALVERLEAEHSGKGSLRWRRARGAWKEARLEPSPLIRSEPSRPLTKRGP